MSLKHRVSLFVVSFVALCTTMSSSAAASIPTKTDSFDQKTINEIHRCLDKYRVAQVTHDYEVYMITGGLSTPNPDILHWDNKGNMIFATVTHHEPMYSFNQSSVSPATWRVRGGLVALGPTTQVGFKPVPWARRYTSTGEIYYEWNRNSYLTSYYFQKGDTYVVLDISSGRNHHYPFPQGVMNHLSPLGNPVQK